MELDSAKMIGAGLATLGFIGPGIGIGLIWSALINSVGIRERFWFIKSRHFFV